MAKVRDIILHISGIGAVGIERPPEDRVVAGVVIHGRDDGLLVAPWVRARDGALPDDVVVDELVGQFLACPDDETVYTLFGGMVKRGVDRLGHALAAFRPDLDAEAVDVLGIIEPRQQGGQ